jgi:hypothetical protein
MNLKILLPTTMIILLLSLFACKKELTDLGSDLVTDGDKISFKVDTIKGLILNVSENKNIGISTSVGSSFAFVLGSLHDNIMGQMKADLISEVAPSEYDTTQFNNIKTLKTIQLQFIPDTLVGGSYTDLGISIFKLNNKILEENFSKDKEFSFFNKDYFSDLNPTLIKDINFRVKKDSTYTFDLPISLANDLVQTINKSVYKDEESFKNYFKGFLFKTSTNNNGIYRFIQSKFRIKVKYETYDKTDSGEQVLDSTFFKLSGMSRVLLTTDNSSTPFYNDIDKETNPTDIYLNSFGNPLAILSENYFNKIYSFTSEEKNVNKAELIINVSNKVDRKELPVNLFLYTQDKYGQKFLVSTGRQVNIKSLQYRFIVTNHINFLSKNKDHKKYIISTCQLDPNINNNGFLYSRVNLFSNEPNKEPQLIISYTKK